MRTTMMMKLGFCAVGAILVGACSAANTELVDNTNQGSTVPNLPHRAICEHKPGLMRCHARARTTVHGDIVKNAAPAGVTPADLKSAYALPSSGGNGKIIAIVDAFDNPNAESDLATYRAQFGLPPCTTANGCFKKVNEQGQASPLPTADAGWGSEISLDLDMASAVCPDCKILLVEATQPTTADLGTCVNSAVALGAAVVSNSYGGGEDSTIVAADTQYFNHPGVLITASSGDSGFGVQYPASSAFVTAVGGTSLVKSASPRGWSETAWSGAGSGCSGFIAKPSWQQDNGCAMRMESDVSAVADPNTGVAVYDNGWSVYGGTSVASPVVAAIYALTANNTVDGSYSYAHTGFFNDVTSGTNGTCTASYQCTAGPGYDGPTGNGTPNGAAMSSTASDGGTDAAANDFALALNPTSGSVQAGSSTAFTVTSSLTSGVAENVSFTITGLPAGVSGAFSPSTVTSNGGSTTLTIAASANAAAWNGTFTVAGASGATTHKSTGSLSVTTSSGGSNLVANGGFESGLSGWTIGKGHVTSDATTVHGGASSARIGSTSAYNGYSTLVQSVAVPSTGTTTFSFWENLHCNDTIQYDWEQVKILNASNHQLKQVFKVCSNAGVWTQTTVDLTPYKGQTVILQFADRDDGASADPTWWFLDDVSVTNH